MDSSASSLTLDLGQILPQSDSASPIRLAAEDPRSSIVGLLREIESKVTTALRFFGVDIRFFPKFVHNLRGAVRPACIAAVSCFV
ncbi:MAG: hypothetical protein LBI47_03300, partial [Puniceicoccales bacterium]|nr:hypothetical protein [Puniceicoccales bacterium]